MQSGAHLVLGSADLFVNALQLLQQLASLRRRLLVVRVALRHGLHQVILLLAHAREGNAQRREAVVRVGGLPLDLFVLFHQVAERGLEAVAFRARLLQLSLGVGQLGRLRRKRLLRFGELLLGGRQLGADSFQFGRLLLGCALQGHLVDAGNSIGFVGILAFQARRAYGWDAAIENAVCALIPCTCRNFRVLVCRTLWFLRLAVAAVWFVVVAIMAAARLLAMMLTTTLTVLFGTDAATVLFGTDAAVVIMMMLLGLMVSRRRRRRSARFVRRGRRWSIVAAAAMHLLDFEWDGIFFCLGNCITDGALLLVVVAVVFVWFLPLLIVAAVLFWRLVPDVVFVAVSVTSVAAPAFVLLLPFHRSVVVLLATTRFGLLLLFLLLLLLRLAFIIMVEAAATATAG